MNGKPVISYPLLLGVWIFGLMTLVIQLELFGFENTLKFLESNFLFAVVLIFGLIDFFKKKQWRHIFSGLLLFFLPKITLFLTAGLKLESASDLNFRISIFIFWAIVLYGTCVWSLRKEQSHKVDVVAW